MQMVDINCMIGEWAFKDLYIKTTAELTHEMERLNIGKAMVYSSDSWLYSPIDGNLKIVREVANYPSLIPVIVLTPLIRQEFGGIQRVFDFMENNNVGAIRLFPFDQNFTLHLWNVNELFDALNTKKVPVFIECQGLLGSIESHFQEIYELGVAFPDTPIVLLNTGYRLLRILYELVRQCNNIYIDTSTFITFKGIEEMVMNFGSERILFGSRMPFMEAGVSIGRILYSDIEDMHKENIFYKNVLRILEENKLYRKK